MQEEKLKLLECIDSYLPHVDGVINCMHNYCVNAVNDAEVTAIAPAYKGYSDEYPYKIIRCKSFYFPILDVQYGQATRDKKFTEKILSQKFDIVHIHSPFNMAKFALKVAKAQGIPAVATFHTNMRPIFVQAVKWKWLAERLVQSLGRRYNQYDEIFVCSPPVAEQCRSYGYKGKISYLPFGTNIPKCNEKDELRKKANETFGWKDDELVFVFVGRIEKLKRIDFILDSLKILKDRGVKFRFNAVGKGSDFKKLIKYKRKLGFTDDEVNFTGFVDAETFPLYYARADMLLFPSLYDNFGLVKVEAAAFDTPGIFIENSCAGYGVTDGVNGYLSADNPTAFAERILSAVSDRAALKQVGEQAGKDLYVSWKDCTEQFIARLKEVVERFKNGE